MGVTFEETIENELIAKNIIDMLPRKCKCGAKYIFSESLTELKCTNNNCNVNTAYRSINMFNKLDIDINMVDTLKIIEKLNIISPYQLLMINEAYDNKLIGKDDIHDIENVLQKLKIKKQNEYLLYEVVELCGIENIVKSAKSIFKGFDNIEDAFEEIETNRVVFINERLGINSSDSAILAVEIYEELLSIKEELMFAETQLKVVKNTNTSLRIAFTDNIVPYNNKMELVDILNRQFGINLIHVTTVNDKTDILVRNSANHGSKIRAAKIINEKFVADEVNNSRLVLNNVGKMVDNQFKPLGHKIYVDTLDKVIERLQYMKERA